MQNRSHFIPIKIEDQSDGFLKSISWRETIHALPIKIVNLKIFPPNQSIPRSNQNIPRDTLSTDSTLVAKQAHHGCPYL
jgi:hypothetical protein